MTLAGMLVKLNARDIFDIDAERQIALLDSLADDMTAMLGRA